MIEVKGVSKSYGGIEALKDLSLDISAGEIFALLGPNGAGKTTTIKLLSGLAVPDQGSIRMAGFDMVLNPGEAKRRIGLIPDEPYIYPKLTAWEFLEMIAAIYHAGDSWVGLARHYLELFELAPVVGAGRLLESFSHGMKQKVVLTSMLMRKPAIWLLDEPLVGLDPKAIRAVRSLILEHAKAGGAVLVSTHVLSLAEEVATKIGIINTGRLGFVGTRKDLIIYLTGQKIALSDRDNLEELFLKATLRDR